MHARVGRLVLVLVGAMLVAVAVIALVAPRPPFTPYRQPVVVGATLAFLLVGMLWRPPVRLRRLLRTWWMPWLVAVAGGWLAVVVATSLRIAWSWDVNLANVIAFKLHTGVALTRSQVAFLSRYPNMHPLVGVHRLAFEVSDRTGWPPHTVLVCLVAVAAGLSVLLVHPLVAPVAGRVRAVAAQLVVLALVAVSPWVAVPYTDVLAMPLLTGSVVLLLRAARRFDRWSVLQLLGSAVLAAAAVAVKATPAVLVVAVGIVGLLLTVDLWRHRRRALVALGGTAGWVAVTLVLVTTFTTGATTALGRVSPAGLRQDASAPVIWWIANGMTTVSSKGNTTRYGGYNSVMTRRIAEMDRATAAQWSRDWIRHQWVRRGLDGSAQFYLDKMAWNWGDGMFWAWGEGMDRLPQRLAPPDGMVATAVHEVEGPRGRWYQLRSDLAQGLWLAVVLVGGVGALRRRRPPRDVVLVALAVVGIAAFTLLFQGRSRYLLTFVPLVVALAASAPRGPTLRLRRLTSSRRSGAAPS
jgi:hypothetical protein